VRDQGVTTYPKSRRVVLGHSPSSGVEPYFGVVSSSSSRRLDTLFHDWRDQALGANMWWEPKDRDLFDYSHLEEIVTETECEVIVALGVVVAEAIFIPPISFEWFETDLYGRRIRAAMIPHPSGLNRFYNDVDNRITAADFFKEALLS